MLETNTLREKMHSGQPVIGIWNTLASPLVTEALAVAGLDFQIIDLEHGPFILDQIHLHVSACENNGQCSPLVRIPHLAGWMALQALDQGAHGLVVPHVTTHDDAFSIGKWSKYPPNGERGFSPFTKAGGFGAWEPEKYSDFANDSLVNVAIVESKEGLNNLDKLLGEDVADVIYFGAYDLSQEYGRAGDMKNPELISDVEKHARKVRDAGKYVGGFVPRSKEELQWNLSLGLNFITFNVDTELIRSSMDAIVHEFIDLV